MAPERWEALSWTPDNPLAVGFSVIDTHAFGHHPLTKEFEQRLSWFLRENAHHADAEGFRIFVNLVEAPRLADRSQWRVHVATDPSFMALGADGRAASSALARMLAEMIVAWEEVEDVDATLAI